MYTLDMHCHENSVREAYFTLDESYNILYGDESFYQMVGDHSLSAFHYLILQEDQEQFNEFMKSDSLDDPIYIHMLLDGSSYRLMFLHKLRIYNSQEQEHLTDLCITDIVVLCNKFQSVFHKVVKYRALINLIQEKIFEYDCKTGMFTIYYYNNNRSEIIEKDDFIEWKKRNLRLGFVEDSQKSNFERLCDYIESGAESFSITFPSTIMSKGERLDHLKFSGQTLFNATERTMTVGIISEVSKRVNHKVFYDVIESRKDPGTGLFNKKVITEEIKSVFNLQETQNSRQKMYLMVIDIDNFKTVNDTYGHLFGDEVILALAKELQSVVMNRGCAGRIGGDEFLVLLRDMNREQVCNLLKSMREKLKIKLAERQPGFVFTISAGLSEFGKDGLDYDRLFQIADGALYIAKEKGKDRYIIYDKEKHGELISDRKNNCRLSMGSDFMQPIEKYDMASHLFFQILNTGYSEREHVLYELMDKLNIHGIRVFMDDDMRLVTELGKYKTEGRDASYVFDEEYQKLFNQYHINKINNITSIALSFPEVYQLMQNDNICSTLQIVIVTAKQKMMVQFDTFGKNRRKWSQDDINTVYIVVKAIAYEYDRQQERNKERDKERDKEREQVMD